MSQVERTADILALQQIKARYFRGVDTGDGDLVRAILAEDCELDYRGCCTDPATGRDFIPAMNVVLHGRDNWASDGLSKFGIVSVHQGHNFEVEFLTDTCASGVWSMTDRLWFPPGGPFALMTGYGHYHERYEKVDGASQIKTIQVTRIRVEAS